ncbi:MAG: helix-turn-helix domain-containing protein [Dermatophilaceae bacterium]
MNGNPQPRRFETIRQAADRLGVSEKTIRRHITAARLTGYRVGERLIRVDPDEVDALLRLIPNGSPAPTPPPRPANSNPFTSGAIRRRA